MPRFRNILSVILAATVEFVLLLNMKRLVIRK